MPSGSHPNSRANLKPPIAPGETRNPGGRPVGIKLEISAAFLKALGRDFAAHGKQAIIDTRENDPARYLAIVAALVPRDDKLTVDSSVTVKDERAAIHQRIAETLATPVSGVGAQPLPESADTRH